MDPKDRKTVVIPLLSICHRGPAPVLSVGSQFGLRLRWTMEKWRYYFNSWRQLSANWRPLHLSPVSTSAQMSSEMLGAGSRHSQLWHVWWGWPVTTQAVSRLMSYTNTGLMTTLITTQIRAGPCCLSDVTLHVLSGPHGGRLRSPDIVRPG